MDPGARPVGDRSDRHARVRVLAAFGGGTLRDILLDRRPFFWVQHAGWLWVLLALTVGAMP
jgi:uncharacterized membrane protein YeiH